jgi:sulfite reductase alpha subunit-like flavoprotein
MASDVERSFVSLYQDKAGVSKQDAETWMAGLKASHRYLADVWPKNT